MANRTSDGTPLEVDHASQPLGERKGRHMHARINTTRVEPGQIDEFAAAAKALLSRAKPQAPDLNSALVLGDRRTGKVVMVSRWDSEAAGDAAEPMYREAMREFGRFRAEPAARERYEVLLDI